MRSMTLARLTCSSTPTRRIVSSLPWEVRQPGPRSIRSKGRRQAGEKSSPDTGDSRDLGTAEADKAGDEAHARSAGGPRIVERQKIAETADPVLKRYGLSGTTIEAIAKRPASTGPRFITPSQTRAPFSAGPSRRSCRDSRRAGGGGRQRGQSRRWSSGSHLLPAGTRGPTVAAVTVSGGYLILVMCVVARAGGPRAGPGRAPRSRPARRTARTGRAAR
jgi:hypothetical protein